jgi:hypothetical protein
MTPSDLLTQVAEILEERGKHHGDYFENMTTISHLWNANSNAAEFTADDVAVNLALVKIARRLSGGRHNLDNYLDAIGYLAIAGAIAERSRDGQV